MGGLIKSKEIKKLFIISNKIYTIKISQHCDCFINLAYNTGCIGYLRPVARKSGGEDRLIGRRDFLVLKAGPSRLAKYEYGGERVATARYEKRGCCQLRA